MEQLNDSIIRNSLLHYLENKEFSRYEIFQELHVSNGRAIADVVTLKKEPHCYEIKGDGDKICRIKQQGEFYDQAFRRITVVTTEKHLGKALEIAPDYWGVMLAKQDEIGNIVLINIRKSKINCNYNKSIALLTLWKSEMLDLFPLKDKNLERKNRATLASLIAESKKKQEISKQIATLLCIRHQNKILTN